jgi:tetratricopeptide (TPR) repeat protein
MTATDYDNAKNFNVLGISSDATVTEIRTAYINKTSQKYFENVFIDNKDIVDEFKRYHSSYINIMTEYSEVDNVSNLNFYPPDQIFKLILNQGIYLMISHNYVKAGEKFQEAYSLNKTNENVLIYLGILLLKRKSYYAAEKYFLKAVKLNKENDDIWVFLGDTYLKAGNKTKALVMYKTAENLNPLRKEISEKIQSVSPDKEKKEQKSFLKKMIGKIFIDK